MLFVGHSTLRSLIAVACYNISIIKLPLECPIWKVKPEASPARKTVIVFAAKLSYSP